LRFSYAGLQKTSHPKRHK